MENYLYFLRQYRRHPGEHFDTLAYCLMPTHFHFLVRVKSLDIDVTRDKVGIWLSAYTKALNKQVGRHGSLFQHHTRAIWVDNERYLIALAAYIHQNPLRAGIAKSLTDWPYSSYLDLAGLRAGTLPNDELVRGYFCDAASFQKFSADGVREIDSRYWV